MVESDVVGLPEDFVDAVRDALLHLYDPAYLYQHVLQAYVVEDTPPNLPVTKALRQTLLDAIDALRPNAGTPESSRAWRLYTILEQRYLEGLEAHEVSEHLALSKSQYHREHQRALLGVASQLWDRWRLATRWSPRKPPLEVALSMRTEVESVLAVHTDMLVSLCEELHALTPLLQSLAFRRGLTCTVDVQLDHELITGDRVVFRQAVLTLFTSISSILHEGQIQLVAKAADGVCSCAIAVTGLYNWAKVDLQAVYPFVEALGGQLQSPLPGTWVLQLPLYHQRSLLVVDNSQEFRWLVARYLKGTNWQVIGAENGQDAFTICRQHRPDCILLDIVLPERDGWEFLEELHRDEQLRTIPVAVCSVLQEPEIALALGAVAYLPKPVTQEQLLLCLAQW